LLTLSAHLAIGSVISLEPRTPHQPGKLQNVPKNEYVFTPFIFAVNKNHAPPGACIFNEVQPVHSPLPGFGAGRNRAFRAPALSAALF
jgi:hypothetical protein